MKQCSMLLGQLSRVYCFIILAWQEACPVEDEQDFLLSCSQFCLDEYR